MPSDYPKGQHRFFRNRWELSQKHTAAAIQEYFQRIFKYIVSYSSTTTNAFYGVACRHWAFVMFLDTGHIPKQPLNRLADCSIHQLTDSSFPHFVHSTLPAGLLRLHREFCR